MSKKLLFLLPVLSLFAASASAQSFVVSPNDTANVIAPFNNISAFDIYQRNTSGDTLMLAWTRITVNLPAAWDNSTCDHTTCYAGIPASGTMLPVMPADSGFIAININPYTTSGTGVVRIYVYDVTAPYSGDTLTWIINGVTGIAEQPAALFSLAPNPAADFVNVHFAKDQTGLLRIMDLNGRVLSETEIASVADTRLNVADLPAGVYNIGFYAADGTVSSMRFVKTR